MPKGRAFFKRGARRKPLAADLPRPICPCGNRAKIGFALCKTCRKAGRRKVNTANRPDKQTMQPYTERNFILDDMGFSTYSEYRKSNLWRSIQKRVFDTKGKLCVKCRKAASQIHHSRYTKENLDGTSLQYLHPVCRKCHEQAEVTKNGTKRKLETVNKILRIK